MLGTVTPTSGTVTVGGHRAGTFAARSLIGVSLAQERSFYLRLSGRENLILFARLRGLSRRAAAARVDELTRELELDEIAGRRADRCSTGQLQQLAFARALLGEPPVLLLDEPTRSLDQEARERVWDALDRRRDRAVVVASHLDEDMESCDRVVPARRRCPGRRRWPRDPLRGRGGARAPRFRDQPARTGPRSCWISSGA